MPTRDIQDECIAHVYSDVIIAEAAVVIAEASLLDDGTSEAESRPIVFKRRAQDLLLSLELPRLALVLLELQCRVACPILPMTSPSHL